MKVMDRIEIIARILARQHILVQLNAAQLDTRYGHTFQEESMADHFSDKAWKAFYEDAKTVSVLIP